MDQGSRRRGGLLPERLRGSRHREIAKRLPHSQNAERGRVQSQERMASIAWAIKIAALTVMKKAISSQVITFVSSNGVERAHPRTVKNSSRSFSTSALG